MSANNKNVANSTGKNLVITTSSQRQNRYPQHLLCPDIDTADCVYGLTYSFSRGKMSA